MKYAFTVLILVLVTSLYTLYRMPDIHKWERESGYPYGKLCDVYRSCVW